MSILTKSKKLCLLSGLALSALFFSNEMKADTAILAGGCFWCIESDFESLDGVSEVVSGFTGGSAEDAVYKQVARGRTEHREAVEITYDPKKISYQEIIHKFLRSVDVTDAGGQFCDRGFQYSTAIYAATNQEAKIAQSEIARASRELGQNIVTPIVAASAFYEAPEYHQDYYKSSDKVITRFGRIEKQDAYKRYRNACGRDQRVQALWGDKAAFLPH